MFGQDQAVGARDRNGGIFEGTDDRLKQRAALAHQDENVSRSYGVPVVAAPNRFSALHPAADRTRDRARELGARTRLRRGVERRVPGLDLGLVVRLDELP